MTTVECLFGRYFAWVTNLMAWMFLFAAVFIDATASAYFRTSIVEMISILKIVTLAHALMTAIQAGVTILQTYPFHRVIIGLMAWNFYLEILYANR